MAEKFEFVEQEAIKVERINIYKYARLTPVHYYGYGKFVAFSNLSS